MYFHTSLQFINWMLSENESSTQLPCRVQTLDLANGLLYHTVES